MKFKNALTIVSNLKQDVAVGSFTPSQLKNNAALTLVNSCIVSQIIIVKVKKQKISKSIFQSNFTKRCLETSTFSYFKHMLINKI